MSIPNKISKFRALEEDFGTTNAVALWQKAAQLAGYINECYPIGMLLFFHETQDNLPGTPDSKYWQAADGSVVSNANSPLNGVTLPDYRNKFFRHPKSGEVLLSTGGTDSVNLSHNHTGSTALTDPRGIFEADSGGDHVGGAPHVHSISSDLGITSTLPLYRALKVYIRIA